MSHYFFGEQEHLRVMSRFLYSFSKLFQDFPKWTFLKCPKLNSLFTFGKKVVTENLPKKIKRITRRYMVSDQDARIKTVFVSALFKLFYTFEHLNAEYIMKIITIFCVFII